MLFSYGKLRFSCFREYKMKRLPKEQYRKMDLLELVKKSQQSDMSALEELIRRNERVVYATFFHLDPKRADLSDLTQEALFRVARAIKNLKKPETFKVWMNQIITNVFYDELRKKSRKLSTISIDTYYDDTNDKTSREIEDTSSTPADKTKGSELELIIRNAIMELPEQFRQVIVLRELQGLTYDEIAQITKSTTGTVKSRIARARVKLQEKIKPYLD